LKAWGAAHSEFVKKSAREPLKKVDPRNGTQFLLGILRNLYEIVRCAFGCPLDFRGQLIFPFPAGS